MLRFFPLAVLLAVAAPARAQTCGGYIYLTSQAQVNAFDCAEITSVLQIGVSGMGTSDITDLSPLRSLKRVASTGLFELTNNGHLTSLDGLDSLESVGTFRIWGNASLRDLKPIENARVEQELSIWDNESLESLNFLPRINGPDASLSIVRNASLTNLNGLAEIDTLGVLTLWWNDALTDVSALRSLEWLAYLDVRGNEALTSFGHLPDLTFLWRLVLDRTFLQDVDFAYGVERMAEISVTYNDSLLNVDGFGDVVSVQQYIGVEYNRNLSNCSCGLYDLVNAPGLSGPDIFVDGNALGCETAESIAPPAAGVCPSPTTTEPAGAATMPPVLIAYPNPGVGPMTLRLQTPPATHTRLSIYDLLGREVAVLLDGPASGVVERRLDAPLPAGVYVARLVTEGGREESVRFTVVR